MVCGSAAGFRNRNRIPFRPTDVCLVQRVCGQASAARALNIGVASARSTHNSRERATRARALTLPHGRAPSITPSLT